MAPLDSPRIKALIDSLDAIRDAVGGDLETQGVAVLLNVMRVDPQPILVRELVKEVRVTQGSVARYLRLLGDANDHPRGGECAGLLQCTIDPTDKRRKLVTLSPKGRALKTCLLIDLNTSLL